MKIKKCLLVLLFILSIGFYSFSQSTYTRKVSDFTSNHELGINLGLTTGFGLTYAYWIERNGIQFTLLPIKDRYGDSYTSVGCSYIRNLKSVSESVNVIGFWGNHFNNILEGGDWSYSTGAGPGVEIAEGGFKLRFMLGYAIYSVPVTFMVLPTVEMGVFVRF